MDELFCLDHWTGLTQNLDVDCPPSINGTKWYKTIKKGSKKFALSKFCQFNQGKKFKASFVKMGEWLDGLFFCRGLNWQISFFRVYFSTLSEMLTAEVEFFFLAM